MMNAITNSYDPYSKKGEALRKYTPSYATGFEIDSISRDVYQNKLEKLFYSNRELGRIWAEDSSDRFIESGGFFDFIKDSDFHEFEAIKTLLNESKKRILALKQNWDDMDGEIFTLETWNGVECFLNTYAEHIHSKCQCCIDIPKIYPSAAGSIDVDWETDDYGILINFAKGGKSATYYADDKKHQITEGVFNPYSFNVNLLPIAISLVKK